MEAPLVNTNEPDAQVIELSVTPYSAVAMGEHLCTLETSKATVEVEAPAAGFVGAVHIRLGDIITAGDPICEIHDALPDADAAAASQAPGSGGATLTRKAAALAAELGVDIADLPTGRFVTEQDVRAAAAAAAPVEVDELLRAAIGATSIVVFGGGGLGRTLIEVIRARGEFEVLGIVDDGLAAGSDVLGVPVIGGAGLLEPLAAAGLRSAVNAIGAIGRMSTRARISALVAQAGLASPAVADPTAAIAPSARLAAGALVFAQAVVATGATVGGNTIVNTGAIVSHDCAIGSDSHIAPGAVLAGEVVVGDTTLVGMGVTASVGLRIGSGCVIGNGSVLTADVPDGTLVAAGTVWTGAHHTP